MPSVDYLVSAARLWVVCLVLKLGMAFSFNDTVRLRNDLLTNYNVGVLPLKNQSMSLAVNMSFFLIMIHNLNMKNQVLTASGWLKFEWKDEFLQWNPEDYGGIDELILFQKDVWLPDVFVENTAQHYRELGNHQMLISVRSSGTIHWEPGIITETSCAVNIGKYPFDTQTCDIRFLTWMHTNKTLTVEPETDSINLDALLPNGEWDITSTKAKAYRYPSTYRPGTDHTGVTFVVQLRRKIFFYVLNTIIPVVMLSCLNVLVFILPSDCGERMALAVTVLLAFTVYLGIISENVPKTSERLSLLAIYLTILLALSTASVVCAGIVLNIHYRDPAHPVPQLLRWLFSSVRHPEDSNRSSMYSMEAQRASFSHWEYRPCYWDQRRPSIWAKRMALRESRRRSSYGYHEEDVCDDRDDAGSESEKHSCVSTTSPLSKQLSGTDNGVEMVVETRKTVSGRQRRPESVKKEGQQPNVTSKRVSYDEMPLVERGAVLNHTHKPHIDEHNMELPVSKRKTKLPDTPKRSRADDTTAAYYNKSGSNVSSDVDGYFYHRRGDNRTNEHNKGEKQTDCDLTWHDIGNSLDRFLFWVFFIVTNTVTIVILSMCVRGDSGEADSWFNTE